MNFVFFSPHFPYTGTEFCLRLRLAGANVLGIGDAPYESLNAGLRGALAEYYRVEDMEDMDEIIRAVGFLTHRHGKIDRFESLNEHWLQLEATIRTDFNIAGIQADFVDRLKHKSKMKAFFHAAGVPSAAFSECQGKVEASAFIHKTGYPVVVKPDLGAGAAMTARIENDGELEAFFGDKPDDLAFIVEEYIDGVVVTYDGLIDRDGVVRLESSQLFEDSVMEVVNQDRHLRYICLPAVDADVAKAGRAIIEATGVRERFFHIELFRHRSGRVLALEINMRPPGAWMTDATNFSHDIDIYQQWANMVVHNVVGGPFQGRYFTGYASRKKHLRYVHGHEDILREHGACIVRHAAIEPVFSRAMGHYAYLFRSPEMKTVREITRYIQAEVGA